MNSYFVKFTLKALNIFFSACFLYLNFVVFFLCFKHCSFLINTRFVQFTPTQLYKRFRLHKCSVTDISLTTPVRIYSRLIRHHISIIMRGGDLGHKMLFKVTEHKAILRVPTHIYPGLIRG